MCDLFQPYHKHTETTWNDHRNDVVRFFFISLEQISRTVLLLTAVDFEQISRKVKYMR